MSSITSGLLLMYGVGIFMAWFELAYMGITASLLTAIIVVFIPESPVWLGLLVFKRIARFRVFRKKCVFCQISSIFCDLSLASTGLILVMQKMASKESYCSFSLLTSFESFLQRYVNEKCVAGDCGKHNFSWTPNSWKIECLISTIERVIPLNTGCSIIPARSAH